MKRSFFLSSYSVTVGVSNNKTDGIGFGCTLHEVGLQPKSRLAAAGTTDDEHVFVPCGLGVFRAIVHGQPFRGGQQHIVFKLGIDKGLDVLFVAP